MTNGKKTSFLSYFTISQKMVLIFIGAVFLPLVMQNSFYYGDTEKNIHSEMMQRLNYSLDEKRNKIYECLVETISLSHRYNNNEEMYKFLDYKYASDIDYFIQYDDRIKNVLLSDMTYNKHVRKISLYTDNDTIFSGSLVNRMDGSDIFTLGEELTYCQMYDLTDEGNGPKLRMSVVPLVLMTSNDRFLSIVRPMEHYSQYSNYKKYLRLDIDLSYISSILEEKSLFDNVVLVAPDNRIIASANTYNEFGTYDIFSKDELKVGIVAVENQLKTFPLTLYGYYDSKTISNEFKKLKLKTISIVLASMTFALLCILFVARNITKRIKLVVNHSKHIAQGNFIQIGSGENGNDEIGVLAESMNQMSMKLKNLIDEHYNSRIIKARLERETVQAKLLALQSQVNPHFMFNALESIRLKAVVKNETETAKMIMYMSRMFRNLINWQDDIICLKDEINFLNEFLNIQKYRFDDEFKYTMRIDEKAKACLLPKFIIQPLVENACVHGVEAISNLRLIEISAVIEENRLLISVYDNGSGIEKNKLDMLIEMLKGGKELVENIGLSNIYQRLVLYYGSEFSFDIISEMGQGTEINIAIPIRYSKEEFCVLNYSC